MTIFHLVLAEIQYRRLNFFLTLLAVVTAAALFVGGPTLISGYAVDTSQQLDELQAASDKQIAAMQDETKKQLAELDKKTRRIMRDIGINLRIVHKDTVLGGLYTDFHAVAFDEADVEKLANAVTIDNIVHVIATLQEKRTWNNRSVFIVGMLPMLTVSQKNEEKAHMVEEVAEGTVLVGYELRGNYQPGDSIDIEGHPFTIAAIMPQMGTVQDVHLMIHLHDAQKVLKMPGKINQITALNCKCFGDRISAVRAELEEVLPNTKVTEISNIATARENQRDLVAASSARQLKIMEDSANQQLAELQSRRLHQQSTLQSLTAVTVPAGVFISAAFIGLLTWLNVRERRPEIGLLRALGKGSLNIAGMFLAKSVLLGLLGGLLGCGLGFALAWAAGRYGLNIPSASIQANGLLLAATVLGAPVVAALASYLPTLSAVTQDPAVVLMDH